MRRFGPLRAIQRQRSAKTLKPLYSVRGSQGSRFILDRGLALDDPLLRLASPGVLPSVAIRAVALGGYVYGSMGLEAASFFWEKGSVDGASSKPWGQVFRLPLSAVGRGEFPGLPQLSITNVAPTTGSPLAIVYA